MERFALRLVKIVMILPVELVSPSGQTAITHFEVVGQDSNFTKVHVILETGRTHQIRVHLSSIGHPVTGDRLYGSRTRADNYSLQAKKLQFVHPITKEMIVECGRLINNLPS